MEGACIFRKVIEILMNKSNQNKKDVGPLAFSSFKWH
jgi:hypothetical protein